MTDSELNFAQLRPAKCGDNSQRTLGSPLLSLWTSRFSFTLFQPPSRSTTTLTTRFEEEKLVNHFTNSRYHWPFKPTSVVVHVGLNMVLAWALKAKEARFWGTCNKCRLLLSTGYSDRVKTKRAHYNQILFSIV